jgi:alkaline phosphatase D
MPGTMRRRRFLSIGGVAALAACQGGPVPLPLVPPPEPPQVPLRRIALASCTDETRPQPIWDTVIADKPDLMIFGGDNVYASEQPWSIQTLRQAYATQAAVPGFARLRRAVPHLAIWDDHDYGLNDGGAEFVHKAASKSAFLDFWQAGENDPRRQREGIYHAETFGPPGRRVQVILLGTRWFRSPWKPTDRRNAPGKERYVPDFDAAKTMLGETQWQWLAEQLRVPAQVRLVVSGVQVTADGHGWERWGNFPLEWGRLCRLITVTRAQGVVFLSGDRHIGALYREARGPAPYPMYELTSSGITHPWKEASEAGPNRLGELFTEPHFGVVEIDWPANRLHLQIKDLAGAVRRSQAIAFDELRIRT